MPRASATSQVLPRRRNSCGYKAIQRVCSLQHLRRRDAQPRGLRTHSATNAAWPRVELDTATREFQPRRTERARPLRSYPTSGTSPWARRESLVVPTCNHRRSLSKRVSSCLLRNWRARRRLPFRSPRHVASSSMSPRARRLLPASRTTCNRAASAGELRRVGMDLPCPGEPCNTIYIRHPYRASAAHVTLHP